MIGHYIYKFKLKKKWHNNIDEDNLKVWHIRTIRKRRPTRRWLLWKNLIYKRFYKKHKRFTLIQKCIALRKSKYTKYFQHYHPCMFIWMKFAMHKQKLYVNEINKIRAKYFSIKYIKAQKNENNIANILNKNLYKKYTFIPKIFEIIRKRSRFKKKYFFFFWRYGYKTSKRLKRLRYKIIANRIANKNFDPNKKLNALPYRELPHLSFQPKKKFKRIKRRKKLSRFSVKLNYRGRLHQFIQFQLHYGCISIKKLKKIYKKIKNKFERNNLFFIFLNYRLFNFLFLINICFSRRLGFLLIKRHGLIINEKKIYNPLARIHFNDLVELSKSLKLKLWKRMIKKRMRFISWYRRLPYNLILNIKLFTFYILKKNIDNFFFKSARARKIKRFYKKRVSIKSRRLLTSLWFKTRR